MKKPVGGSPVLRLVQTVDQLDQDEARDILMKCDGNITRAAELLRVDAMRLRLYVASVPALARAMQETMEQGVDLAVGVLFEGLRSDSFQNRFYAAKEMLKSAPARKRGFGRENAYGGRPVVEVARSETDKSAIVLKWLEPPEDEDTAPRTVIDIEG